MRNQQQRLRILRLINQVIPIRSTNLNQIYSQFLPLFFNQLIKLFLI